jgi:predicted Zn finger-like uncharacterized protein
MKNIIAKGINKYRGTCPECGTIFTYEREDVHHDYVHGGERVSCPHCAHSIRHFGAGGSSWMGRGSGDPCMSVGLWPCPQMRSFPLRAIEYSGQRVAKTKSEYS